MYFLNNILSANFDEEEIENVSSEEHANLKYNKR